MINNETMVGKLGIAILIIAMIAAVIAGVFTPAALAAGDNLIITADTQSVYVGEPKDVKFTVTVTTCTPQNGTVCILEVNYVQGATVTLTGGVIPGSGTTESDGTAVIRVIATVHGDITATAKYNGSSASTVIKAYARTRLKITADTESVYVGKAKIVNFTVTEFCPQGAVACTQGSPVNDSTVRISGGGVSGNYQTDTQGKASITINAKSAGNITATASKDGYDSGSVTITAQFSSKLNITADTDSVDVGIAKAIKFTVTEDCLKPDACTQGSVVQDVIVQLSGGGISGNYQTDTQGQVPVTINATSPGTITASASKEGYANGSTTITARGQAVLNLTADTQSVIVGKLQVVTFTVNRVCGSLPNDQCTGTPLIPISGVNVTLSGVVWGNATTDSIGIVKFNINASRQGTINATARKDGYEDAIMNITAVANGTSPTPTSTPSPGSGNVGSSSSGSSGSSGGGGGGGITTAEPFNNILKSEKRDANLFKGKPVTYSFSSPEFSIYQVLVTGKENEGDVSMRIERLKNTSALVNRVPPGIIYSNENIWVSSKKIEYVVLRYRINNSWIAENGLDVKDIALLRFNNGWKKLDSTIINNNDSTCTYFESRSPGMSSFAISGLKQEAVLEIPDMEITGDNVAEEVNETKTNDGKLSPGFEAFAVIGIISIVYLLRRKKGRK